jgi:hypothetical protein
VTRHSIARRHYSVSGQRGAAGPTLVYCAEPAAIHHVRVLEGKLELLARLFADWLNAEYSAALITGRTRDCGNSGGVSVCWIYG